MASHPAHLATITPINSGEAGRIMNLPSLLLHNALLLMVLCGWVALIPTGALLSVRVPFSGWVVLAWIVATTVVIFIYPEWPVNRLFCARLRRAIVRRNDRPKWVTDPEHRVVELVPRENWAGSQWALETASDLLLLRIDSTGVQLEGDRDRYALPHASIIHAELQTTRPSGWFTDVHMVVICARTDAGPVELPISYRDHGLGSLRCSRRRDEAIDLVDKINQVATGGFYQPVTDPDLYVHTPHSRIGSTHQALNPYQAPQDV